MDFGKYIKELLLIHDCVILPGLGGFIANYKPAEIHPARQTIEPPSRQILFNRNLVHNDGLLYAHASQRSGYGYKEIQSLAEAYVRRITGDVSKGLKFSVEEIGYFYLDREKQLQFFAEASANLLIDSYGLPFVHYQEFETPVASRTRTYRTVEVSRDPLARQRMIRRITISAAAACLAAALVMIPIKTGYFSEAGLDISPGDSFTPPETQPVLVEEKPEIRAYVVEEDPSSAGYHIIVGSFKDFGNARELRKSLVEKGYPARILAGENAFYRVSAGQSSGRGEATQVLADIRSRGFESAWMLSN